MEVGWKSAGQPLLAVAIGRRRGRVFCTIDNEFCTHVMVRDIRISTETCILETELLVEVDYWARKLIRGSEIEMPYMRTCILKLPVATRRLMQLLAGAERDQAGAANPDIGRRSWARQRQVWR